MNIDKCRSSFKVQPYRRKYLKSYCERMSKDNTHCLWDHNVASVLQEQGFTIPESPRSVYKVDKLYEALSRFEPSLNKRIDVRNFDVQSGIRLARKCFGRHADENPLQLSAFSPELVYSITSNHKGSAGLTAWGKTKAESYVYAYDRGLQQIKGERAPEPCIAFSRTQFNDKTRLIWGYPYAMTALEGIFARPLIDLFKKRQTPMAFAKTTGTIGTQLRVASYHKEWAYSTDVSSYDSSISSDLIKVAFNILASWFDLEEIEPTSKVSYRVIWHSIINYFIRTPIFMPDGNLYLGKNHGVPSGSYFTQMIDSIVNVIMVGAISQHFHLDIDRSEIFVLGDDILFWTNRSIDLEVISQFATELFGAKFNPDKSSKFHFDEPIHYLGRIWTNGVPDLNEEEILKRMVQPERFRKYSNNVQVRRRQVRLLLLTYATVYKSAFKLWYLTEDRRGRYFRSIRDYEYDVIRHDMIDEVKVSQTQKEWLTGLARFKAKYVDGKDELWRRSLALQYWL